MNQYKTKCRFCSICNGKGCIGELPGMGGFGNNVNTILNYSAWKELSLPKNYSEDSPLAKIRLAPMTGGVENIGYPDEVQFYYDLFEAVIESGAALSIGDGCPDLKFESGIAATETYNANAAVFIKPYTNDKIFTRIEKCSGVAESIGIDIDSYNIVTMRNLVNLENKNIAQLKEIKNHIDVPFSIKGIFHKEEIELIKEVKPDIVVISNHGGRIETRIGSSAEFFVQYGAEIKKYCGELWVDGGIRTKEDIQLATAYGADEVLIGRPFATALCSGGKKAVVEMVKNLL